MAVNVKLPASFVKFTDPEIIREIRSYQNELDKTREEHFNSTLAFVSEIRSDLETLKSEVMNFVDVKNVDCLRTKMLDVEDKIGRLKGHIKEEFLVLVKDGVSLSKDLQFMERRMEDWEKPLKTKNFKAVKPSIYRVKDGDNPASEFQKFLSSFGGHCGGWNEQDHLLFLRERKKYKGKDKFLSVVHCLLPDLTYDEIADHEDWYEKYESLKKLQKEAIQKWKSEKTGKQTQKEENIVEKTETKGKKKRANQRNIAERIRKWKEQQLSRKLEEEERLKVEKIKLQEEERKKKELQQQKKQAVTQYKAEKLKKVQEESLQKDNATREIENKAKNILLKSFRLQDIEFIEKKKIIRLQVESKANNKVERLKLTKPGIELLLQRDPQRVFQPTLIWSQHCRQEEKTEKVTPVFHLESIPRLAIPEWRRELK